MGSASYELHVTGLSAAEGAIPVRALQALLGTVTECATRGLRLAVEGSSVKSGPAPAWLAKGTDLTFTGLGPGCTKLMLEAPGLGDVLSDELLQPDLFLPQPNAYDTALSLLSQTIRAANREDAESDYIEQGVLNSLLDFKAFFRLYAETVELVAIDHSEDTVLFGLPEIEKAEHLIQRTPAPRAFVLTGALDTIHHRQKRFLLELSAGQKVPGRIEEEFMSTEELRSYWGKMVTIKGIVHFRPSGRVQMLEAHTLAPSVAGDEVFAAMPKAEENIDLLEVPASKSQPFEAIRGTWPGDETIEELLAALPD